MLMENAAIEVQWEAPDDTDNRNACTIRVAKQDQIWLENLLVR